MSLSGTKLTCPINGTSYLQVPSTIQCLKAKYSQVTLEEATAKSNQLGLMFMETSAKAGHNVKSLFKKIAMSLPGMEKDIQPDANTSPFLYQPFCQTLVRLTSTFQKSMLRHQPRQIFLTHRRVIVENFLLFTTLLCRDTCPYIYRHYQSLPLFLVDHITILPARILDEYASGSKCFRGSHKSDCFLIHGSSYSPLLLDFRL